MFRRPHHRRIAQVLEALDADVLAQNRCWFGGRTAIALTHGEYRESADIVFLVSDPAGYKVLRGIVREQGVAGLSIARLETGRPPVADNYGIRALVLADEVPIKFEIVHEGRITFGTPSPDDEVCGVRTLAPADQVAGKLLANDDRWPDPSVFSRDLIDLAMMRPSRAVLAEGFAKAADAYGPSVRESLSKAAGHLRERPRRLDECMRALGMEVPKALVWREIRRVVEVVEAVADPGVEGTPRP